MEFAIASDVMQRIREHALLDAPSEACGVLVRHTGGKLEAVRMRNAETGNPQRLYSFDPYEQEKIWRYARDVSGVIHAVYHSHPEHGPEPSALDHALSAAEIPWYLIYGAKGDCFAAYRPHSMGLEWHPLLIQPPIGKVGTA